MNTKSLEKLIHQIDKSNLIKRIPMLLLGTFLYAICYNAFLTPNNIIIGGSGGIALIVNNFIIINIPLFINIFGAILLVLSAIICGFKDAKNSVVGLMAYVIMLDLTEGLSPYFVFDFDSMFINVLLYASIMGIGCGFIIKSGFNTGGVDSIITIIQKFNNGPYTTFSLIINGAIVLVGLFVFGLELTSYAIVFLCINNFISNRFILGSSNCKICFIKSNSTERICELLKNSYEIGYTILKSNNGVGRLKKDMIMVIVPSDRYYNIKHNILDIDKKAIISTDNCFTVEGGKIPHLISM